MKRRIFLCLAFCPACSAVLGISESDQAARNTALNWLAMVDAGEYVKAWTAYPPRIKSGGLQQAFLGRMRERRFPLGHPRSRKFMKVTHTHRLNGAPDGDYQIIAFKSSFDRKATAVEE